MSEQRSRTAPGDVILALRDENEALRARADAFAEAVRALIDGDGWGDDTVDDWWRQELRRILAEGDKG